MRLVRSEGADVLPLPAIARFNYVDMTAAQQRLEAGLPPVFSSCAAA